MTPWVRWFLLGMALGLGGLGLWWRLEHHTQKIAWDFAQQFEAASLRRPGPDVFAVREVTISGVAERSITVQQPSRIAWDVTVPDDGWVETELALEEESWTRAGDGVLFRVGISFDGRYEELVTRVVNPFGVPEDRRWVPIAVDLAPYAGRAVSLIFNTGSGFEGDNRDNDLAVWGAPRLVTR
jgi:hypothetical protein